MEKEKAIKSTLKKSTVIILVITSIAMSCLACFFILYSLKKEYPDLAALFLGGCFAIIGLLALLSLINMETLELYEDKLLVKSIFKTNKKVIYLKDIISYNEIEKANKAANWFDLTIFFNTSKYLLSSSTLSNYDDFKQHLIKDKLRNTASEEAWQKMTNRRFAIGFIIFGLLFLCLSCGSADTEESINPKDLTSIKITTKNNLVIDKSKNSSSIRIPTNEYPQFSFELYSYSFYAAYATDLVADVIKGDTIEIDLLTDTYEKKIAKTKPMTFWDKTINYSFIGLYGIRKGKQEYLTLQAIKEESRKDKKNFGWIIWIFRLLFFAIIGFGVRLWLINK